MKGLVTGQFHFRKTPLSCHWHSVRCGRYIWCAPSPCFWVRNQRRYMVSVINGHFFVKTLITCLQNAGKCTSSFKRSCTKPFSWRNQDRDHGFLLLKIFWFTTQRIENSSLHIIRLTQSSSFILILVFIWISSLLYTVPAHSPQFQIKSCFL